MYICAYIHAAFNNDDNYHRNHDYSYLWYGCCNSRKKGNSICFASLENEAEKKGTVAVNIRREYVGNQTHIHILMLPCILSI
jgi:hypothetical protein